MVVPIFAPNITDIACGRLMSPALTNPMTMTVVAELLWRTAVTSAPAKAPIKGFLVRNPNILFIFSPAAFWSASLMLFIPYRNIASPPSNPNTNLTLSSTVFFSSLCKSHLKQAYPHKEMAAIHMQ